MGNLLCHGTKISNSPVDDDNDFDNKAPAYGGGQVHMLILALDYKKTPNPLSCSIDGKNMEELARACNISDVTALYDEQCSKQAVIQQIQAVGSRCQHGDFFVFYYSGHGMNVEDVSGDEDDGQDEAFCLVDGDGQVGMDTLLLDEEFAEAVTEAVEEGVQILILTDCCHSGTIADLDNEAAQWGDREVISITGCEDSQTSGDIGTGGIFTHSMLMAINELEDSGEGQDDGGYSVGKLYNTCLENDNNIFHSKQDITIQYHGTKPSSMAWPLNPVGSYVAPLKKQG